MISFKSFLAESRSAPLYHATPVGNVPYILSSGFAPNTLHNRSGGRFANNSTDNINGVSFSRQLRSAIQYIMSEVIDEHFIVFEVDQKKITNHFKIRPIDYFKNDRVYKRKEAEEFVIPGRGRKIPASVITKIHYNTSFDPTPDGKINPFNKDYLAEIKRLKAKYPQYKWVPLK